MPADPRLPACVSTMARPTIDGITFEASTRTYVACWGSMHFDFFFGTVRVNGPPHLAWLDVDRAYARSISTAIQLDCSGGMALALEIQDQYLAWLSDPSQINLARSPVTR